jgi:hypothetical protein
MPEVGFEPTIPAFERAKTVHYLDGAVTVTGTSKLNKSVGQAQSTSQWRRRCVQLQFHLSWRNISYFFVPFHFLSPRTSKFSVRENGVIAPQFLSSAPNGGKFSASRPGSFIAGKRAFVTGPVGRWVGPRAGLETDLANNQTPVPWSSSS